jgi:hypothetical protein
MEDLVVATSAQYRDFICVENSCVILCKLLLIVQDLSENTAFNVQGLCSPAQDFLQQPTA